MADKKKKIQQNIPSTVFSKNAATGIFGGGFGTSLKKGFYKAIQATGPAGLAYGTSKLAVMGVQNGKGKSRKSIMPGLTRRIKEIVQGGDSTKVANYTKWLNSFGGTPTNHPMSDYEHSMELKAKKKKKNK